MNYLMNNDLFSCPACGSEGKIRNPGDCKVYCARSGCVFSSASEDTWNKEAFEFLFNRISAIESLLSSQSSPH